MRQACELDPRFNYLRYEENRGGAEMNEIGMKLAIGRGEFWSRLGSDDHWDYDKLYQDYRFFTDHPEAGACYGRFRVVRHGFQDELCNPPHPSKSITQGLSQGAFFPGWANIAVRTSILKKVLDAHGRFSPVGVRNMEDLPSNFLISRFTDFYFRDGGLGYWRDASADNKRRAASSKPDVMAKDRQIILQFIKAGGK